jgi:hypothetical protein
VLRAVIVKSRRSRLLETIDISSLLAVQALEKENTRLEHLQSDINSINISSLVAV